MAAKWPYANGKAPSTYLVEVEPGNHLRPDAAAAWVLFRAACYVATGVWLTITSANRSYDRQVELFLERYTRTNTGRKSRVWNGVRYWLRAGAADAAVPGTSNHGWAIAVDMGGYTRAWTWIVANCARFGFSLAEGLSVGEKWHIVFTRAWDGVLEGGTRIDEGPLANPSPTNPAGPKEDTLSAAEVTQIKNFITKMTEAVDPRPRLYKHATSKQEMAISVPQRYVRVMKNVDDRNNLIDLGIISPADPIVVNDGTYRGLKAEASTPLSE